MTETQINEKYSQIADAIINGELTFEEASSEYVSLGNSIDDAKQLARIVFNNKIKARDKLM